MKVIIQLIHRFGQHRIAIPILVLSVILQVILINKYLPEFLNYSGGIKNPDQLFSYSLDYLMNLYETLDSKGRAFYGKMLSVDFFFAAISGIGYALLLSSLISQPKWFIITPLILALLDIIENTSQLILMHDYPEINPGLALMSSMASASKMILSLVTILLILFFIVRNIVRWIQVKRTT